MLTEYQVLYELGGPAHYEPGNGAVHTLNAMAEGADQLRHQFSQAGFRVIGINRIRPIVDWEQPNFDRDEAAEFFRVSPSTLTIRKAGGEVPWSKIGQGIYPRRWLEKYVLDNANPAGKEIAAKLRKEAA